jgi:putative redox protein
MTRSSALRFSDSLSPTQSRAVRRGVGTSDDGRLLREPGTVSCGRWLDHFGSLMNDRGVPFEVEFRNVGGQAAAIGSAGPYTLVVDRPADSGGRGLGFNGGQLLYLAIGGCVSNDLFREAAARGIRLTSVRVVVRGDFSGDPAVSDPVDYEVELAGDATADQLQELVMHVDAIAEIPNSVRRGTAVRLGKVQVTG